MVLTKAELVAALQNEVRILLHLAGKVDPAMYDYRPTSTPRSTLELLAYLTMMGPTFLAAAVTGVFDEAAWRAAERHSPGVTKAATMAEVRAATVSQSATYALALGGLSDDDLRSEISLFGPPMSRVCGW